MDYLQKATILRDMFFSIRKVCSDRIVMDNRYGMRATILLFEQGHGSAKEEKLRGYLRHTSLFRPDGFYKERFKLDI